MVKGDVSIWYGDGHQALYYDEKTEEIDLEGNTVKQILVVPDKYLKEQYNLTEDKLPVDVNDNGRRGRWMTYNVIHIIKLKFHKRILILCDFLGRSSTDLIKLIDAGLLEAYKSKNKEIHALKISLYNKDKLLTDHLGNQFEIMKKEKVIKEMMKDNVVLDNTENMEQRG